jgi:hypothetical protein
MELSLFRCLFILFVYICNVVGDPINRFNPPPVCSCPKPESIFQRSHVLEFSVFNGLKWKVVVHHHCLNAFWIVLSLEKTEGAINNGQSRGTSNIYQMKINSAYTSIVVQMVWVIGVLHHFRNFRTLWKRKTQDIYWCMETLEQVGIWALINSCRWC